MIVCLNGKFVTEEKAKISVFDNGFLYGDGFYDTMKSVNGVILELPIHIERIFRSAETIGIKIPYSMGNVKKWILETARRNHLPQLSIRIMITRGRNGLDFLTCKKATLVITCKKIAIDPKIYKNGIKAFTVRLNRILPEIKTIGLTALIKAYRSIIPKGGNEAIFVDEKGFVREGGITNIFIVKNGKIVTPKDKILKGITRNRVILLAKKSGFKMAEKNIKVSALLKADEVFLTNCPREVIPVSTVNGRKIGNGKVGHYTKEIMRLYQDYVSTYLKANS